MNHSSEHHASETNWGNECGDIAANNDHGISFEDASLLIQELPPHVNEELLRRIFTPFGPIASIRVCSDGCSAYVCYKRSADAQRAMNVMNRNYIEGKPCKITWVEHDPCVVLVRNLSDGIDSESLRSYFETFGEIWNCYVATDQEIGKSTRYGFVRYETSEAAGLAKDTLDGTSVDGRVIKVEVIGVFHGDDENFEFKVGNIGNDIEEGLPFTSMGRDATAAVEKGLDKIVAANESSDAITDEGASEVKEMKGVETIESNEGPEPPFALAEFEHTKKQQSEKISTDDGGINTVSNSKPAGIEAIQATGGPPLPLAMINLEEDEKAEKKISKSDRNSGKKSQFDSTVRAERRDITDDQLTANSYGIFEIHENEASPTPGSSVTVMGGNRTHATLVSEGTNDSVRLNINDSGNNEGQTPPVVPSAAVAVIPQAFLVDENDEEVVAAQAEPLIQPAWWKDTRAKMLLVTVAVLLAAAAIAVGISYASEKPASEFQPPNMTYENDRQVNDTVADIATESPQPNVTADVSDDENTPTAPTCVLSVQYDGPLFETECEECTTLVQMHGDTTVVTRDGKELFVYLHTDRDFKLQESFFDSDYNISHIAISTDTIGFVSRSIANQSVYVYINNKAPDGMWGDFIPVVDLTSLILSTSSAQPSPPAEATTSSIAHDTNPSDKQMHWYPSAPNGGIVEACTFGNSYEDWMALDTNRPLFLFETEEDCCAVHKCSITESTVSMDNDPPDTPEDAVSFNTLSLDLSDNLMLVGVNNGTARSAHIFRRSQTEWLHEAQLSAEDSILNDFGSTVSISGDMVAVGDRFHGGGFRGGVVFVYENRNPQSNSWTLVQKLVNEECDGEFGTSVTFNLDGELFIGCPKESPSGAVYHFSPSDTTGNFTLTQKFTPSDGGSSFKDFGSKDKVSLDGGFMAVGSKTASNGRVHIYAKGADTWAVATRFDTQYLGKSISLSANNIIVSSISNAHYYSFGYFNCLDVRERIETDVLRRGARFKDMDEGDPRLLALDWILHKDEMNLGPNAINLSQRFILALMAYSTDSFSWQTCGEFDVIYDTNEKMYNETPDVPSSSNEKFTYICIEYKEMSDVLADFSLWLSGHDECNWAGVSCNDGVVSGIDLAYSNLIGEIPPEISGLKFIRRIKLNNNLIASTLPPEIGELQNLEYLDLGYTSLYGTIPSEIIGLKSIQSIFLNDNCLYGTIPSEIGKLQLLQHLNFGYNGLSGFVPIELFDLTSLVHVDLSANYDSWQKCNASDGTVIDANYIMGNPENDENKGLEGEFFGSNIGKLANLEVLTVYSNDFRGTIGAEISNLKNLVELHASENVLTGSIPSDFTRLKNLKEFWLENNRLTGNLPSNIGEMNSLEKISVWQNEMGGMIPDSLYNLTHLQVLFIHNTYYSGQLSYDHGFEGSIKTEIGNLKNLTHLFLQSNPITGMLPTELALCEKLEYIKIQHTQIQGTVPFEICELDLVGSKTDDYDEVFVADCRSDDPSVEPFISCDCCDVCCDHSNGICVSE